MENKEHLPVIGVGPLIVIPQVALTGVGIILSLLGFGKFGEIDILKIPFVIIGIIIIVLAIYMWYCANYKVKVFDSIIENKLATNGVYGIVRNPIYSAFFLACVGMILITNNLVLFVIPVICWIYMTIFLKMTEEKWLDDLYGEEYRNYCKRVNRCIPWFPRKMRKNYDKKTKKTY